MDIYSGAILVSLAIINWLSGESLLVLAGPVVVLPTAWIAWRMIRKSYG